MFCVDGKRKRKEKKMGGFAKLTSESRHRSDVKEIRSPRGGGRETLGTQTKA